MKRKDFPLPGGPKTIIYRKKAKTDPPQKERERERQIIVRIG